VSKRIIPRTPTVEPLLFMVYACKWSLFVIRRNTKQERLRVKKADVDRYIEHERHTPEPVSLKEAVRLTDKWSRLGYLCNQSPVELGDFLKFCEE